MRTEHLATVHTACIRARDALNRLLDAFDGLAMEVARAPAIADGGEPLVLQAIAAMLAADAPAVAKALAVIAPAASAPQPISPARTRAAPKPTTAPTRGQAGWSEEQNAKRAEVQAARPTGEVIVPPTAKITRAPSVSHDPRYQVDPTQPVRGGFMDEWRAKRAGGSGA